MKRFQSLVSRLSEPSPQTNLDPKAKQAQWKKNTMNLYCLIGINSIILITFPFSDYTSTMNIFNLFANLFFFILFILLCRSHLWLYGIIHTLIISFASFPLMDHVEGVVYYYLGYAFALPPFMMILHGDVRLASVAGGMQIIVQQFRFKQLFCDAIIKTDPIEFSERFVGATTLNYSIMLFAQLFLLSTLNKKTIELEKAKKATEEALEQQRTFIFSFSHELRNPINSLLGNLQLVLLGEASASISREMINTAKVCGEILLQAINNVLDTGKHEMGNLEVNPVPTRIHELFQRTWAIYNELLRQKKLKSHLKIEKKVPAIINIDSHKINQILLNLIGNAIKFTEKGSINITVKWQPSEIMHDKCFEPLPYDDIDEGLFEKEENLSTVNTHSFSESVSEFLMLGNDKKVFNYDEIVYPQTEAKGILKIIIRDSGCGMKNEDLKKLFKKFSQVSEDISRRQIGTGLGLFITKEICKAMDGDVRAYSKPNIGTTFIVCIPTNSIPVTRILQRNNSQAMINTLKQKKLKVIVADDSPFNVSLTCNYFNKLGASVASIAYNGYDAFIRYKESQRNNLHVDIITLDIDMPIMDGKLVCDKIRQNEKENNLEPVIIILISGNYDKEQINEYLDKSKGLRADFFLKKPVAFEDFNAAIYNLLVKD